MQTPFLRASEFVILSRKRIDNDGPKLACQSANFRLTQWVRTILVARTESVELQGIDPRLPHRNPEGDRTAGSDTEVVAPLPGDEVAVTIAYDRLAVGQ